MFISNEIDEDILADLTEPDLAGLGVALGDRKRMLHAIAEQAAGAMARTVGRVAMVAERRQLTVMFCDLVGFTQIAARLDPEDLREVLQRHFEACAGAVRRYGGTVTKQMGDGLLVSFGHPQAHEDDPQRAVHAGLEMIVAAGQLSRNLQQSHAVTLDIRIGIHTGQVVIGELGAHEALESWAIVGETPNVAARLQDLAQPNQILVSDATRRLAAGRFEFGDLGLLHLKGFAVPIRVHRVLRSSDDADTIATANAPQRPLVNRVDELAAIFGHWEKARNGAGQVMYLSGEAGSGKTRLMQEVRDRLSAERATVIQLKCSPHHQNTALFPLVEQLALGPLLMKDDAPNDKLDKLDLWLRSLGLAPGATVPLLAELMHLPVPEARYPPMEPDPKRRRAGLFECLLQIGAAMSARNPVLLVVEDTQWCDPSLAEFLGLAVRRYRSARFLIALTFRLTPPALDFPDAVCLPLGQLTRDQSRAVVLNTTGGRQLPDAVIEEILNRTDGVPLYLEELTKALLGSDALALSGDSYVLTGSFETLGIPASLQDSLMARLDRLEWSRGLVRVAAVLGRSFTHEQLARVAGIDAADLGRALREVLAAGIFSRSSGKTGARYEFHHGLMQQIAYRALIKPHRIELHQRAATVLQQDFPEIAETQPEILARHYEAAEAPREAIALWRRAGIQASGRSANIEAIAHFDCGLLQCQKLPAGPDREEAELSLLLLLGARLLAVHGFAAPEVETIYNRARILCETASDQPSLLPVLWGLWGFYVVSARLSDAAPIAAELHRRAQYLKDPAGLCAAHYSLAVTRFYHGDLAGAAGDFDASLAAASPRDQNRWINLYGIDLGVCSLSYLSWVKALMGRPDEAQAAAARALARARAADHSFSRAFASVFVAQMHLFLRDSDGARLHAEAAAEVSRRYGYAQFEAHAIMQLGRCRDRNGDPGGLQEVQRGLAAYHATGAALAISYAHAWLAEGRVGTKAGVGVGFGAGFGAGAANIAADLVETTLARNGETGETHFDAELLMVRGDLHLQGDEVAPPLAETCYRRAIALARSQRAALLWVRAELRLFRLLSQRTGGRADPAGLAAACGACSRHPDTADLHEAKAALEAFERLV